MVAVYEEIEEYEIIDLRSLGVNPKRKTEPNDKKELEELADNIKQSMFQDYKLAHSQMGDKYEEESKSTVNR